MSHVTNLVSCETGQRAGKRQYRRRETTLCASGCGRKRAPKQGYCKECRAARMRHYRKLQRQELARLRALADVSQQKEPGVSA